MTSDGHAGAVEAHGGTIGTARANAPGKRRAKLRQSLPEPPARDGTLRRAMTRSPDPRILLVEDEASIAEPFAKLLRREGFDAIVAAHRRRRARARARDLQPDLVLLDLALPDGDGRDVVPDDPRRVRRSR